MAHESGARKVFFGSAAPRIRLVNLDLLLRRLMVFRHPHIYGIDLASPTELIAHKRSVDEIAEHIGAEKIIFQELDDLKDACIEAVCPGLIARENQEFEVGVFNGEYVTPVPNGYFAHLEKVRGKKRKLKVMENAREAVANGSAGKAEIQVATNGVLVNGDGKVPAPAQSSDGAPSTNGQGALQQTNKERASEADEEEEPSPKYRMDIGLHNQADFEYHEN